MVVVSPASSSSRGFISGSLLRVRLRVNEFSTVARAFQFFKVSFGGG